MPKGALAQYLRALFGQKENLIVYFSKKKGDHYRKIPKISPGAYIFQ